MSKYPSDETWSLGRRPRRPQKLRWASLAAITAFFTLAATAAAFASVSTDQADYAPGSVVTISGDNSNGAAYLAGEAVAVDVSGPNGYTSSCEGTADALGAWSCQVTLWDSDLAVGSYAYTATGLTSGASESGTFTDAAANNLNFVTSGLPSGVSITITGAVTNNGGNPALIGGSSSGVTFSSPGPSADTGTKEGTVFTYSGYPATIVVGAQTCTLGTPSPASGSTTGAAGGVTTVTAPYTCVTTAPSDATAPSITYAQTPDGNNDWFKTSPATVTVTATDVDDNISSIDCTVDGNPASLSNTNGIGTSMTASGDVSTIVDGDHTVSCTGTDTHSNTTNPAETTHLKLDATAPTVTCETPPSFLLNESGATVSATVSDDTSKPLMTPVSAAADTSSVGSKSVSLTGEDNAGNTTTVSCAYSVTFQFLGFFTPVNNLPTTNNANAGQAIPLKWRLLDASGDPVTDLASVKVSVTDLSCSLGSTFDAIEEYAAGSSGLQNLGDGYYQFNWKTPKSYAKSCKTMKLDLGEGTTHDAGFTFTK